jgi:hypothetical protein
VFQIFFNFFHANFPDTPQLQTRVKPSKFRTGVSFRQSQ